jgi:hypothetical protein
LVKSLKSEKHRNSQNMPEYFDFSVGVILGVIITFAGNYFMEKMKEREQRRTLAKALVTELKVMKEHLLSYKTYKIKEVPIFSANIPSIVLFRAETIDAILRIYLEINYGLSSVVSSIDVEKLTRQIDDTVRIIENEL